MVYLIFERLSEEENWSWMIFSYFLDGFVYVELGECRGIYLVMLCLEKLVDMDGLISFEVLLKKIIEMFNIKC